MWHNTAFTCLSQLTQRGSCIAAWPLLENHKASNTLRRLPFSRNAVGDAGAVAFAKLLDAPLGTRHRDVRTGGDKGACAYIRNLFSLLQSVSLCGRTAFGRGLTIMFDSWAVRISKKTSLSLTTNTHFEMIFCRREPSRTTQRHRRPQFFLWFSSSFLHLSSVKRHTSQRGQQSRDTVCALCARRVQST